MKRRKRVKLTFLTTVITIFLAFSIQAQAALDLIGTATYNSNEYNLIYDRDFEIAWLDYSNPKDNWVNQVGWAAGLNAPGELTYNFNPGVTMNWSDEWQLPTALNHQDDSGPCSGYNCEDSEMGHLYYAELGNVAPPILGWDLFNTGDFQNLQSDFSDSYWSGTESGASNAWYFSNHDGSQFGAGKINPFYAIAVRPGLAVVPEPISSILFIAGGATLGLRRYRKKFIT